MQIFRPKLPRHKRRPLKYPARAEMINQIVASYTAETESCRAILRHNMENWDDAQIKAYWRKRLKVIRRRRRWQDPLPGTQGANYFNSHASKRWGIR